LHSHGGFARYNDSSELIEFYSSLLNCQVVNHGVPESLMDAAMEMNQKFHALSAEEKAVYKVKDRCSVGYGRLFEAEGTLADWVDRMNWWSQPDELKEAQPMLITNPPGMQ
jgi:isopenicillin N synthase-like dioxygenase